MSPVELVDYKSVESGQMNECQMALGVSLCNKQPREKAAIDDQRRTNGNGIPRRTVGSEMNYTRNAGKFSR